ncbi:hypothetical protein M407DRAFT_82347 [Tulasnella calospora MUT 4182]|uniref:Extracellular metalloproteinase n=1 Tax=Tulasnella calospora MUT 4182 TaxID=1051891 RepID=A0A0C3Q7Z9_9AGAM|nr:hypothetical protein M407DRAFT_82347 [Tulasnella calospora MUT 4182]
MHSKWAKLIPFLAGLCIGGEAAPSATPSPRKTTSFGPQLLHATYTTSPRQISFTLARNEKQSVIKLAHEYVKNVLDHPEGSWKFREDSYLDENTGVWHLYLRQVIHDGSVEVTDGDINLNVLNGKVISYGDSVSGSLPIEDILNAPDGAGSGALRSSDSERIARLYDMVCSNSKHFLNTKFYFLDAQYYLGEGENRRQLPPVSEAVDAALFFILAVHPNVEEAAEILQNVPKLRRQITSTSTHHFNANSSPEVELENVPATVSPVKATLAYVQTPCKAQTEEGVHNGCTAKDQTSALTLVWKLVVEMQDNWYEAHVDARLPTRIMNVIDWVSDYAPHGEQERVRDTVYRVWPWGVNDPQQGKRDMAKSPHDQTASPLGWHAIPAANNPQTDSDYRLQGFKSDAADDMCYFTTTWGNNVQAQENWEGRNNWLKNYRPEGSRNLTFVYPYGASEKHDGDKVDPKSYIDLSVAQMFYTSNMVHDLYYRYGFNEVAGNFQNHNFGKGGQENDGITANAQDGSGYNNANFATPPDGQRGRMRMYVWDTATPFRDGDLEAGIVIHELSHGLSTRLTGGPANSGCLGWGESGGMGEGWGDFLATVIRSTAEYSDYPMGAWAANREKGIRNYIYSTNMTTNPSVYKTLDGPGYWGVHAIGEVQVWAEILFVVLQGILEKHPYGENLFPPQPNAQGGYDYPNDFYLPPLKGKTAPIPKHGNALMVQLVLDGMKLQPCRPSFFAARDAIIQADENLTGGDNHCVLWSGFARRGLGPFAQLKGATPWGGGIRTNDFSVPVKCGGTGKPDRG